MGGIDPNVGWMVIGVILLLANLVMTGIRTHAAAKRKPSLDADLGTISTRIKHVEEQLKVKQDTRHCEDSHRKWESDIKELKDSQNRHITSVAGDIRRVFDRIESMGNQLGAKIGNMEGTLKTYIEMDRRKS